MASLNEINIPHATANTPLAELKGSPKQVSWAKASCRPRLLAAVAARNPVLAYALRTVDDATWFIANKDRPYSEIRWPDAWMTEAALEAKAAKAAKEVEDGEEGEEGDFTTYRAANRRRFPPPPPPPREVVFEDTEDMPVAYKLPVFDDDDDLRWAMYRLSEIVIKRDRRFALETVRALAKAAIDDDPEGISYYENIARLQP